METVQVTGNWLGTGLQNSVKSFAGGRTVVKKEEIEHSGASSISDVMRRIPGVQISDNSSSAGTAVSLNIGVRGLTGRYSPRSTVLLDGIPLAFAPYGQPQLSFAPVSLNNIESVDVIRGGGAVRYGPQNVGGIINFNTRAIPTKPGITGDASFRRNEYGQGGGANQTSAFIGTQLDNGTGLALLYSGTDGSSWRVGSKESMKDVAIKFRHEITSSSEVYGKLAYYDVRSLSPGGLTVAQYAADPFQNTRPHDVWTGHREGVDLGYTNTLSATQEFQVRTFYNESFRSSALANTTGSTPVSMGHQPRNYQVLGVEPHYTQRFSSGAVSQDVSIGYRFMRERGDEAAITETFATGARAQTSIFYNGTDAHALYIDDRIALGAWRLTPGLRYERITSNRKNGLSNAFFELENRKVLPSVALAYLLDTNLTLFANYGTSFGPIQNSQLNSLSAANPLQPELAKTIEFGSRWKSAKVSAEATVFNMRFDNQIQSVGTGINTTFYNLGATRHDGVETAFNYRFDKSGMLAGLSAYANYTYIRALIDSGALAGNEVPFYSRHTDTIGARYEIGAWGFNLSATHQSKQFADEANTVAESANGQLGVVPGFRVWNAQANWKVPGNSGLEVLAGVNNLADTRFFTRASGSGKLLGAPRMAYLQARFAF